MLVPVFLVRDVPEAIAFYSDILDFDLAFATPPEAPFYAVLNRGTAELHINLTSQQEGFGRASAIAICDDVDALFGRFQKRGLSPPTRADSPVHQAPLDQTWGTREVYIDDPSGNTIIYQQR